ncbi:MAG: HEAT repeat domain-containing protein [Planctomycetes bacterium]|nr:HEAT repeat domain-containing protein [Planctomycetota bacterium]
MKTPRTALPDSPLIRRLCGLAIAAGCAVAIAFILFTRRVPALPNEVDTVNRAGSVDTEAGLRVGDGEVEALASPTVAGSRTATSTPSAGDLVRLMTAGDRASIQGLAEALKAHHSLADVRILLEICGNPGAGEAARQVAFELLGFLGDPEAVADLTALASDSSRSDAIRGLAILTLGQIGEQAPSVRSSVRDLAFSFLASPSADLRRNAVNALGLMRTGDASAALLDLLRDPSPAVRARAAWALSRPGDPSVSGALIEATRAERDCFEYVQALSDLKAAAAVPVLFEKALDTSEEDGFREFALAAIGRIGDRSAVPGLIEILEGDNEFLSWGAAKALAAIGDPAALPALERAARTKTWKSAFVAREVEEIYAQCSSAR